MKKLSKALSVIMTVLLLASVSTNLFAVSIDNLNSQVTMNGTDSMEKIGSTILTFITNIAMILAVVLIAILGVKYMMGSAEEKAEYKKSMMPYVIGAALVFAAAAVGKIVVGMGQSLQ